MTSADHSGNPQSGTFWSRVLSNPECLGELLELYRDYLLKIANEKVPDELRAKMSPSDFVQETLCEASVCALEFKGRTSAEFKEWLKQILLNNLADGCRAWKGTLKRNVSREFSLDDSQSPIRQSNFVDTAPSPSHHLRVSESYQTVLQKLQCLAEVEQAVIRWRCFDQLTFPEIAQRLGKSEDAVQKIWSRAIAKLAEELQAHAAGNF